MATLYFKSTKSPSSTDWNDLGDWWMDSAGTIPATSLPSPADDVVIKSYVWSNSGPEPVVSNLLIDTMGIGFFISITVTGLATCSGPAGIGGAGPATITLTGNVLFTNGSYAGNYFVIDGDATFDNSGPRTSGGFNGHFSTHNNGATVTGSAVFLNGAHNAAGILKGNVQFSGVGNRMLPNAEQGFGLAGFNSGVIEGSVTFPEDGSYNSGTIEGDATFEGAGSYNSGTVLGTLYLPAGSNAAALRAISNVPSSGDNAFGSAYIGTARAMCWNNAAGDSNWATGHAAATGSVSFSDQPLDGETLTINSVVFEFDSDASTTEGNVAVAIGVDLAATIATLGPLVEANVPVTAFINGSVLNLVAESNGPAGNYTMATTSGVISTGDMSGGLTGNWWYDSACTIPAPSLPDSSTPVVLFAAVGSNSGVTAQAGSVLAVTDIRIGMDVAGDISATGLSSGVLVWLGGTFTFTYNSSNYGTVALRYNPNTGVNEGGNAIITAGVNDGLANGSNFTAQIQGNATFLNNAWNAGTVGVQNISSVATFDNSYNSGTVNGSATFDAYGYNQTNGTVHGGATFSGNSRNYGNVGYTYAGTPSGVEKNTTFNDSSYNLGWAYGQSVVFNDASYNRRDADSYPSWPGEVHPGPDGAMFNDTSRNGGHVFGNAIFNDNAYIDRGASTRPYYTDDGVVTGTATFRGASYNKQSCGSVVVEYAKGINGSSILGVI